MEIQNKFDIPLGKYNCCQTNMFLKVTGCEPSFFPPFPSLIEGGGYDVHLSKNETYLSRKRSYLSKNGTRYLPRSLDEVTVPVRTPAPRI